MSSSNVKLSVGSKVIIAEDTDLRGDITIGSGSVIHPKATIHALEAPITLGPGCIVEELVVIINRSEIPMRIGASNLFEVASRLESVHQVGDHNTFGPKARVLGPKLSVGSFVSVGAGVVVTSGSGPFSGLRLMSTAAKGPAGQEEDWDMLLDLDVGTPDEGAGPSAARSAQQQQLQPPQTHSLHHRASAASGLSSTTSTIPEETSEDEEQSEGHASAKETSTANSKEQESIPDKTTLFLSCPSSSPQDQGYAGATVRSQPWSGQGFGQDAARHAKHLEYLRETIPREHKLRSII